MLIQGGADSVESVAKDANDVAFDHWLCDMHVE
jgi:hypothetical protein